MRAPLRPADRHPRNQDRLRETLEACAHDDDAAEDALQAAIRGTRGGSPGLDEPNSMRARAASFDSAAESDDASLASLTSLGGYSSISLDAPPSLHGSSIAGDDAEFIDDLPRAKPSVMQRVRDDLEAAMAVIPRSPEILGQTRGGVLECRLAYGHPFPTDLSGRMASEVLGVLRQIAMRPTFCLLYTSPSPRD